MTQKVFDYNIDTALFEKYSTNVVRIANVEVTDSNYNPINEFANTVPLDNTGGYIKIHGFGFAANAQVYYNVNTTLTTTSITSTEIRAVVPAISTGNYNLYVQNPSGATAFRIGFLKVADPIAWSTSSTLTPATTNTQTSIFITATSDSSITYELISGSLPPNFYLNTNTGEITGNVQLNIPYTTYSFTVLATDAENQESEKLFNLSVANTVVFSITPAVSGKTTWILATDGPLSLTATTPYTIVPNCNAAVNVVMWGAGGGSSDFPVAGFARGGGGGFMRGHLKMYKSNTYTMTVGGGGASGVSYTSGGGGGASGIETTSGHVLMVAGGGGGTWGEETSTLVFQVGGAGGGRNGQGVQTPDWPNGFGGTQTAGGAGGNLGPSFYAGFPGTYKAGGKGASPSSVWPAAGGSGWAPGGAGGQGPTNGAGGAGGGGGYYGGGGGASEGGSAQYSAWGGGGGSGYLHPTEVLNHASNTGGRHVVANTADTLRGTAGNGGASQGQAGTAGKIYITHLYTL